MADKLSALRSLMASHSPPLHALIVPSEDYHQSEYVSDRDKRRQFISGFSGSAGLALITTDDARLWTDGRYFLQAEKQLSDQWKLMRMGEDPAVEIWMADNLPEEAAIGVDPWSVSIDTAQRWERALEKKQQKLVSTSNNLVDQIWNDRPEAEVNPVKVQPLEFAGRTVAEKLQDLRRKLMQEKAHSIIISALDEVAWLFNVRGNDVSYCPVVHAFAVVTSASTFFYVDQRKVSSEVQAYMVENKIEVRDYDAVGSDVDLLAINQLASSLSVSTAENKLGEMGKDCNFIWMDPRSCCYALYSKLKSDQVLLQQSPLALAKALKNPAEMEGLKKAHMRDGAAVVQFLVWLDKQMQETYGAPGYFSEAGTERKKPLKAQKLTEVLVSDKLEGFRASKEHFRGLSFPTISSVGPNAAIIHYGPDPQTCAEMDPDQIYLFDSGAQYQDGTTDITRTVHFGQPSAHEKTCYTGVLKGHIALGDARFPKGTNGHALDILARVPLWKHGLDYRHGTGHGIGSYLNVHEGPHLISFRPQAQNVPLQAAMTVTDEPGYYEDGNFGIRLENVLIVNEANTKFNFGDRGYLEFEHITWNFTRWSRGVRRALIAKNKEAFITGVVKKPDENHKDFLRWKRADYMVMSWILSSMNAEIADDFAYIESAIGLWQELKERFGQSNGPLIYQLKKEIDALKQENMTVTAYYGKMKKLWDELYNLKAIPVCSCGVMSSCTCNFVNKMFDLEAEDKLMHFLLGLNSGFDSTITNILAMDPLPTINRAFSIVQQIEKQKEVSGANEQVTESSAMAAQRFNKGGIQRFNTKNYSNQQSKKDWKKEKYDKKCDHCKGKGHTIDQCFELIGYPEWYNAIKASKNTRGGQRMAANVTQEEEDPLCQDNSGVDPNMINMICQEVMKSMKGKHVNNGDPGMSYVNFAGPF